MIITRTAFFGIMLAPLLRPWKMLVPTSMTATDLLVSVLPAYLPTASVSGVTLAEVAAAVATITKWPGQLR